MTSEPQDASLAGAPPDAPPRSKLAELAADAVRYWELRRLFYNMVLATVVLIHLVSAWPGSMPLLTRDRVLVTFMLAVAANILYCAAYPVDLFVQFAGLRATWSRLRWILWTVGTVFAATITHFIVKFMIESVARH